MNKTTKAALVVATLTFGTMTTASASMTPTLGSVRQAAESAGNTSTVIAALDGHTATLSGFVRDGIQKEAAVDAVTRVPGVQTVIDHINVYD